MLLFTLDRPNAENAAPKKKTNGWKWENVSKWQVSSNGGGFRMTFQKCLHKWKRNDMKILEEDCLSSKADFPKKCIRIMCQVC